uniref:PNPLA domain-containing protein n=1 Tax=Panagrellus redivivus TaxID=6233 RepID=A0A7E4UUZ2_PANRE
MTSFFGATFVRLTVREYGNRPRQTDKESVAAVQMVVAPVPADLLEAVQTQCIAGVVRLYAAYNLSGDAVDNDGNNALHLAVKTNNVLLVRTVLLLFDRKYKLSKKRNNKGKKPIDMTNNNDLRKSFEIIEGTVMPGSEKQRSIKYEMEKNVNQQCMKNTLENQEGKMSVLLSLDGGGIRGIVHILILMALERKLPNPVTTYFDWIAGTSTGAIVALALSMGKSLEEILRIYLKLKSEIFTQTRPYNVKNYETYLKESLGAGKRMSEIKSHKIIITSCLSNIAPPRLKLFRNYQPNLDAKDLKDFEYDDPESVYCWKAARASSAAPTYFAPFENIYCDGGIMANNPTTEILTEFHRFKNIQEHAGEAPPPPIGCVLSLGTGITPPIAISSKGRANDLLKLISKTTEQIKNMTMVFIKQLTASDGLPVERSQTWSHSMGVPFFRFSPPLTQKVELDESRDVFIMQLMWDVENYLAIECADEIDELVKYLQTLRTNEKEQCDNSA